jgi:hypothetical protein
MAAKHELYKKKHNRRNVPFPLKYLRKFDGVGRLFFPTDTQLTNIQAQLVFNVQDYWMVDWSTVGADEPHEPCLGARTHTAGPASLLPSFDTSPQRPAKRQKVS